MKINAEIKATSSEVANHSINIDRYNDKDTGSVSYLAEVKNFDTKADKVTKLEMKRKIIKEEIIWVLEQMDEHPVISK